MFDKRLVKAFDLFTELGLSIGPIPAADKLYSLIRDHISIQRKEKAIEFHRRFLLTDDGNFDDELSEAELDSCNYPALFEACLSDIEQEKSSLYGHLTKMIARNNVPRDMRRHFILKLKEMTWEQLDLLARTHVINSHKIMSTDGSSELNPAAILESADPFSANGINIHYLIQNNFLANRTITKLGTQFIQSCFPADLRTPGSYEYIECTGARFAMISLQETTYFHPDYQSLDVYFRQNGVMGGAAYLEEVLETDFELPNVTFALVNYHNGKKLNSRQLITLEKLVSGKATLQVIFTKDPDEIVEPLTSIPHIAICEAEKSRSGFLVYEKIRRILRERESNGKPTADPCSS